MTTTNPDPRYCKAFSRRSGAQCRNIPMQGSAVCRMHGGSAPQVREKARERLAVLASPAVKRLSELLTQDDDRKVALGAARDILDRNDLVGKTVVEHNGDLTITRIVREIVDPTTDTDDDA
jgi:hypothetical protein